MLIKIHKIEFDLLKSIIRSDSFEQLSYTNEKYNYIVIDATGDIVDELVDQLTERLMRDGFNSDFIINSIGNQIESLIDRISVNE